MADAVGIVNGAIGLVGGEAISSLPALSEINNANIANRSRWAVRLYANTFDSTLSLWAWNDARARRVAGKAGEAPAFGFSARYPLEADELKVCGVRACGKTWMREGRFILHSGGDSLPIMTIRRVPAEQLSGPLAELVSARLAHRVAAGLGDISAAKKQELKQHAKDQLTEALMADSWEGGGEVMRESDWWLATQTSYRPELDGYGEASSWAEQLL